MNKAPTEVDSSDILKAIVTTILDDTKAEEVEIIDLRNQQYITDYMIIASGTSSRQVVAMAEKIDQALSARGQFVRVEGAAQGDWVVVDAGDVIVHLFRPEVRAFYNIERMWRDHGSMSAATRQASAAMSGDTHLLMA